MDLKGFKQEVTVERLNNGLDVILCSKNTAPVAAVQMWCKTGSIHEDRWLGAGLSHVLEHMLFKGTNNRTGTEIDHLIQDAGGYFNAYTSFDRTVYHVTIPSSGTSIALDVLSDISLNATLPEDELNTELDVIRREMEMGNDDPSRRSSRRLFETAFTKSPYRYTVIGYRDIFDQLDREAINEYYTTRYAPNNCFFVVVGDIEKEKVLSILDEKYAAHSMRALPPVHIESEPRQVSTRKRIEKASFEQSHFHYSWHIPDIRHEDIPSLDVLSVILGGGRSSRLFRHVRDKQELVHTADAWTFSSEHAGLFGMSARSDSSQMNQACESMIKELDVFKEHLVGEDELVKSIKQFTAGNLATLRTAQGIASDLGSNWLYTNDLQFSWKHLESVQCTNPEMIRSVANRYLTETNKTLYALTPELNSSRVSISNISNKSNEAKKVELPNGLRIILKNDSSLPFAHFRSATRSGLLTETVDNNGITRLMSKVMIKGTRSLKADEIAGEIESAGGGIETYSGNNSHGVSLDILSGGVDLGQKIFLDVLLSPSFNKSEVERERKSQLAAINQQRDHLLSHTMRQARRLLIGDVGYGLDPLGETESVSRFTPDQLNSHFESITKPSNSVITVFGDIDVSKMEDSILTAVNDWAGLAFSYDSPEIKLLTDSGRTVVKTQKEQSVVVLAYHGSVFGREDQLVLDLISEALNDMGSRLFNRIREELGLAYYVGTQNFSGVLPGCFSFYAGTGADSGDQVEEELISQAKILAKEGLTCEELNRAKAKLLGQKKIARQELGNVAFDSCMNELLGLGFNYSLEQEERIEKISLDQISTVCDNYFSSDNYAVAISIPTQ